LSDASAATARIELDCLLTVTPRRWTSVGSAETARCTRLLTLMVAWSASVPVAKVTVSCIEPELELTDCM
jgi:hypothetical protein